MDRTYDVNPSAAGGNGTASDTVQFKISDTFFKKVNIPIEFDATAGAITEITSNNIGILLIADGSLVNFDSKIRLRFEG